MEHFFDTVETIGEGLGFSLFGPCHLLWLAAFVLFTFIGCICYRKCSAAGRGRWRKALAFLLIADEAFKTLMLLIGGNYSPDYLPLHLCSINIFLIAFHAFRPTKTLGNYLYTVGIPGALAALLFPSWASLPPANFMHIHSFTVHMLLSGYPIIVTSGGDIRPDIRYVPRCLLLLIGMALPIYGFNLLFNTNFMFLMYAEAGNPLLWFEEHWGCHLLGFPVIVAGVLMIMHLPPLLAHKKSSKNKSASDSFYA